MKPLLLVSQNNSGSTWFARCIVNGDPRMRDGGHKEFFNPVLNWRHQRDLRPMGCEEHSHVPYLARPMEQSEADLIVRSTWKGKRLTFAKDNNAAFKLDAFQKHFRTIVLLRDVRYCFPPERVRVMVWFAGWYDSILLNGWPSRETRLWLQERGVSLRMEAKAMIGWQLQRWRLQHQIETLGLTWFDYDDLLNLSVGALTDRGLERGVAEEVVSTRLPPLRPHPDHVRQWVDAFELLSQFQDAAQAWEKGAAWRKV